MSRRNRQTLRRRSRAEERLARPLGGGRSRPGGRERRRQEHPGQDRRRLRAPGRGPHPDRWETGIHSESAGSPAPDVSTLLRRDNSPPEPESRSRSLWQQDRNVPFGKVEMSPLISDRSLPFPLAPIVLLAAEPVKASLRRAQRRRAALTEPAASGTHFPDQEGMGSLGSPPQGDVSTLLQRGTFLLCRDTAKRCVDRLGVHVVEFHQFLDRKST